MHIKNQQNDISLNNTINDKTWVRKDNYPKFDIEMYK